jgi:hypothetical protein
MPNEMRAHTEYDRCIKLIGHRRNLATLAKRPQPTSQVLACTSVDFVDDDGLIRRKIRRGYAKKIQCPIAILSIQSK